MRDKVIQIWALIVLVLGLGLIASMVEADPARECISYEAADKLAAEYPDWMETQGNTLFIYTDGEWYVLEYDYGNGEFCMETDLA